MRIPLISLLAAGTLAMGGCAYGTAGLGYGSPYSSYGYGEPFYGDYGYSSRYGGYGYGSPYYGSGYGYNSGPSFSISIGSGSRYPYGYGGYGSPYYGWHNNYYYPGTGYYVYDRYRRPFSMNSQQRSYWTQRARTSSTTTRSTRNANWSGFERRTAQRQTVREERRQQRQAVREQRRQQRQQDREAPREN